MALVDRRDRSDRSTRWIWILGGAALIGGGLAAYRKRKEITQMAESAFQLLKNAYQTVEEWAADRGRQIRAAFGVVPDALRPEGSIAPSAMNADEWNRRKIETLSPAVRPRFTAFLAAAQAVARRNGAELIIWDASRTLERQVELYKRGRTVPGTVVTYAIATVTGHIWGMAVDLIFRTPAGQPSFEWPAGTGKYPRWYYSEVLPLASTHRLESLYRKVGKDPPHIQVPTEEATVTASAAKLVRNDFPGLA